jgi:hypothetical protein
MFEVDAHATVNCPNTTETGCTELGWHIGGFQGARGSDKGAEWFIENVMEELDAENEFFFDKETSELYLYYVSSLRLEMYTLFSLFPSRLHRLAPLAPLFSLLLSHKHARTQGSLRDDLHNHLLFLSFLPLPLFPLPTLLTYLFRARALFAIHHLRLLILPSKRRHA